MGAGKNLGTRTYVGAITNGDASGAEFFDACRTALGLLLQKMPVLELFESVEHEYLHKGGQGKSLPKSVKGYYLMVAGYRPDEAISRRSR